MAWQKKKQQEIMDNILSYFQPKIRQDPESTLHQVEQELQDLYIREGNNWAGRGVVGDTIIQATIEALEIVRSDCIVSLQERSKNRFSTK